MSAPESGDFLRVEELTRRFGEVTAVDRVTLGIPAGEVLALLGPSGSGKTTTLRLLAGFESPDSGRVVVDGEDVTRVAPVHRRFGMVFQHYALFPHLDVGENVAFGLESLKVRGGELGRRVAAALALVDLAGYERRPVSALSGGQQQRVAVARALAPEPRVLLLDEPLSNLDPALRERTRRELRDVIRRVGITTVLVTHEQEEAFDLGDRIAVLREGRVEQVGTADELYDRPATAFVAGFIGRAAELQGELLGSDRAARVRIGSVEWPARVVGARAGDRVRVLIRPEALQLERGGGGLAGTVVLRRFVGASAFFTVELEQGGQVEVSAAPDAAAPGDAVRVSAAGPVHAYPLAAG